MQKDWQRKKVDTRRGLHSIFVYMNMRVRSCVCVDSILYDLYVYSISRDIVHYNLIFIYSYRILI